VPSARVNATSSSSGTWLSTGRASRRWFSATLIAIRQIQVVKLASPRYEPIRSKARTKVRWTTSAASASFLT